MACKLLRVGSNRRHPTMCLHIMENLYYAASEKNRLKTLETRIMSGLFRVCPFTPLPLVMTDSKEPPGSERSEVMPGEKSLTRIRKNQPFSECVPGHCRIHIRSQRWGGLLGYLTCRPWRPGRRVRPPSFSFGVRRRDRCAGGNCKER